jgi:hypothetical protein
MCATLRKTGRTEKPPSQEAFDCHYIEWFARKLLLDASDPWRGGFYVCACRSCGARWEAIEVNSSSDNSPVPDTTWYEWRPGTWTDAGLQAALRDMPRLEAEQKARAKAQRGESAYAALLQTLQSRREEEARRERERPRRSSQDTWVWGPPGREDALRVWPEWVDHNSLHGHPQDGWRWTHEEFLAAYPDFLPREVYDQAAALVRSMRGKRRRASGRRTK